VYHYCLPFIVKWWSLTGGNTPTNLETQLGYTLPGVPCSQDTGLQATQQVRQVLATSQCVQEGTCQASAAHTCVTTGSRRRRSTDTMSITITLTAELTFDGSGFNIDQLALDNSTGWLLHTKHVFILRFITTWFGIWWKNILTAIIILSSVRENCISRVMVSEPSADLVTLLTAVAYLENTTQYLFNETTNIFAVVIDGTTYIPDATSVTGSSSVQCKGGYVRNAFFCGECFYRETCDYCKPMFICSLSMCTIIYEVLKYISYCSFMIW